MNQILETDINSEKNKIKKRKKLSFQLKIQLYISIILILIILLYITYTRIKLYKSEKFSSEILNNYNITKLYSNDNSKNNNSSETENSSIIIGTIEIPSLDIYYPIFTNFSDELLKISPCKFYGPSPGEIGNLCIVGHNYDNNKFFSKIKNLKLEDKIIIYDNNGKEFTYLVKDNYEVESNNFSPIYKYNKKEKQITLITCNNLNDKRIIIQANM